MNNLTPMDREQAAALTKRLIGSYPSHMPNDAKTYSAQLMTLLAEYPLWAGERAVQDRVQTKKWLPTVSQLRKAREERVRVIRDEDARDETRRVANAARLAGPVPEPRPTYE